MVLTSNKNNNDVFVIIIIIIIISIIITWNVIGIACNKALTGRKLSFALVQHFDPCAKLNLRVG
jgi:hypothetical protein